MAPLQFFIRSSKEEAPTAGALVAAIRKVVPYLETRRCLDRILEGLEAVNGRSVAVTSFEPREGKSVLCLALAAAARERGLKVLILDSATFVRPGSVSLEEALEVEESSGETVATSPALPGVDYQPWIFRDGARIKEGRAELERLARSYDLVLLDTAALNAHNRANVDPQICARLTDGTILVGSGQGSLSERSQALLADMKTMGVRFLGLVGNRGAVV